ncbi:glycosyltransferase, partial [Pseudomonas syringae group genomosp. 7]|uniref:glycosyltransferase n=1 Tax=Pseudomonas syringae group genomosp. 7 TaxID=251699 RepID=UPI00376FEF0C
MYVTANNTWDPSLELPLLSFICPAYNQEAFVAQGLDGFLSQQSDFNLEILINDDASKDGTACIIAHYEE